MSKIGAVFDSTSEKVLNSTPVNVFTNEKELYYVMQFQESTIDKLASWENVSLEGNFKTNEKTNSKAKKSAPGSVNSEEHGRRRFGREIQHCPVADKWVVQTFGCEGVRYRGERAEKETDCFAIYMMESPVSSKDTPIVYRVKDWYNFNLCKLSKYPPAVDIEMLHVNRKRTLKYNPIKKLSKDNLKKQRILKYSKLVRKVEKYNSESEEADNNIENNSKKSSKKKKKGKKNTSNQADNYDDKDNIENLYASSNDEMSEDEAFYYGKSTYKKLLAKSKKKNKLKLTDPENNNSDKLPTTSANTAIASTTVDPTLAITSADPAPATISDVIPLSSKPLPKVERKPDEYAAITEAVKRYLRRKPMTTVELLKKIMNNKDKKIPSNRVVKVMTHILRRLKPIKRSLNGKVYLSLDV